MSDPPKQPTEEEMRAAYEAELKRISVEDVIVQTAVSLVNLAGRRLGLAPGAEDERDLEQVRDAIDAIRGLLGVLERKGAAELGPIRDALSQLQMAYAKERGAAALQSAPGDTQADPDRAAAAKPSATAGPGEEQDGPGPGPAQSSGRLWVPGQ